MKRFQETYILHLFICRGLKPRNGEDLKVKNMNFVDAADIPLEQHADENDASVEDTQEDEYRTVFVGTWWYWVSVGRC